MNIPPKSVLLDDSEGTLFLWKFEDLILFLGITYHFANKEKKA